MAKSLPDKVVFFSGEKVCVTDLDESQSKIRELAHYLHQDAFLYGVLKNVNDELEVVIPDSSDFTRAAVKSGAGWILDSAGVNRCERVELDAQAEVILDNASTYDNIVYIYATQKEESFRPHYISGVNKATRSTAGTALGAIRESSWPVAGAMALAKVGNSSGRLIVKEDLRKFLTLKPGYSDAGRELNVAFVLTVDGTGAALFCDDLFAAFRPDSGDLKSRIIIESLHATMPTGGLGFVGPEVYIGVWDSSAKETEGVWVDIKPLAPGGSVANEVGGTIGNITETDHRFHVGFRVDDPSTLGIDSVPGGFQLELINLTIRYRMA